MQPLSQVTAFASVTCGCTDEGGRKQRGLEPILPVPFPLQRLPVLHCFLKSRATFPISDPKPHEQLIQFQMIWKTLNPNNTGRW